MELKVEKAIEHRRLKHEIEYLRHTQQDIYDFDRIVGASGALQSVLAIVKKVAKSNTTVPDPRRNGHRQGADRRRDPPQLAARGAQLRQGQLRGAAGEPARVGAVRPREGRLHRRRQAARRPLRAGRRRHAVPRRSRRHEREHAGQDPARAAGARVRAPRRHAHAARRRPAHRGDQPQPAADGRATASSARTSTTASTSSRSRCRRCASARTTSQQLATFFLRRFAGELKKRVDGLVARRAEAADALQLAGQHPRARERDRARGAADRGTAADAATTCASASCRRRSRRATRSPVVKIPPTGIALEEIERQALIEALKMSNWVQKDAAELLAISPRVMNYKIKTLGIDYSRGGRRPMVDEPSSRSQPS